MQTICAEQNDLQLNCQRTVGQSQISKCLKKECSFTKEDRQCKPGVQTKQSNFNWWRLFGQAQHSKCLKQGIFIFKVNRQCKPCVPNKTICNPIVQEQLDKLKIPNAMQEFSITKETDSANQACLTKQSDSDWSRIFGQAQNSKCLEKKKSFTKENRNAWLTKQSAIQLSKNA